MRKTEFLKYWEEIESNQEVIPEPLPYKHEGSTFDHDTIRITGSEKFIESVLSNLKELLEYEYGETRLQVSYTEGTDIDTDKFLGSYKCYIQVHERGSRSRE